MLIDINQHNIQYHNDHETLQNMYIIFLYNLTHNTMINNNIHLGEIATIYNQTSSFSQSQPWFLTSDISTTNNNENQHFILPLYHATYSTYTLLSEHHNGSTSLHLTQFYTEFKAWRDIVRQQHHHTIGLHCNIFNIIRTTTTIPQQLQSSSLRNVCYN